MPSETWSPRTQLLPPQFAGMPRLYRSEREASLEASIPERGSVLGDTFGPAYATHIVLDSTKVPRGNKTILVVDHCAAPSWPVLSSTRKVGELNALVRTDTQVVLTPANFGTDPAVTYQAIDEFRSRKITETPPTAALDAFHIQFASTANLRLPRTLVSVAIVWQEAGGNGSYDSDVEGAAAGALPISISASDDASASGSKSSIPELQIEIRENDGNNVPTTSHLFYLPMPVTTADIIAKLGGGVSVWPRFKPVAHTILCKGVKVSARANSSGDVRYSKRADGAEQYSKKVGRGEDFDFSSSINAVTIPPTIHGAINISGTNTKTVAVSCTADVGWTGFGVFPSLDAAKTASTSGAASVEPTSLSATTPALIPTSGTYLIDSKVEPYDWGYARVFAETINASVLA